MAAGNMSKIGPTICLDSQYAEMEWLSELKL